MRKELWAIRINYAIGIGFEGVVIAWNPHTCILIQDSKDNTFSLFSPNDAWMKVQNFFKLLKGPKQYKNFSFVRYKWSIKFWFGEVYKWFIQTGRIWENVWKFFMLRDLCLGIGWSKMHCMAYFLVKFALWNTGPLATPLFITNETFSSSILVLLPFGKELGDSMMVKGDDAAISYTLKEPFPFFTKTYPVLYVSHLMCCLKKLRRLILWTNSKKNLSMKYHKKNFGFDGWNFDRVRAVHMQVGWPG